MTPNLSTKMLTKAFIKAETGANDGENYKMLSVSNVSLSVETAKRIVSQKFGRYTQQVLDQVAIQMGYESFQAVPPMIKNAIYLMLALVVVGSLASAGFGAIFTTNTSGWSASTVSVYYIIPIAAAIAIALYFFNELR